MGRDLGRNEGFVWQGERSVTRVGSGEQLRQVMHYGEVEVNAVHRGKAEGLDVR